MRVIPSTLILCLCVLAVSGKEKDSLLALLAKAKQPDTMHINILNRLSYLTAEDDSVQALNYVRQAMEHADKISYRKGKIDALYQLAYIREMNFNYADATRCYQQGIALSKVAKLPALTAYGFQDYALVLKKQNLHREALRYNDSALEIYTTLRDTNKMAVVYANIGNNYKNLNLFDKAISYHLKALRYADSQQNHRAVARAWNNIGLIYERTGDHEKALSNYLKMERPALESGDKRTISVCYGNIGASYQNLKQHEKAIHYLTLARKLNAAKGMRQELTMNLTNIASSLNSLEKYDEAAAISEEAAQLAKEINDEESLGYAHMCIGVALRAKKRYTESEKMLKSALEIAEKIENNPLLMIAEEEIARLYADQNKPAQALEHFQKLAALKDTMYNAERHEQVASLQTQYETEQKDRELAEQRMALTMGTLQMEKKNKLLIIAILSVGMLGAIITILIRNSKFKQKQMQQDAALMQAATISKIQEEKLRISRELHDNIGSQLTFINTSLQSLAQGEPKQGVLQETQVLTLNTIRELRNTVWLINKEEFTIDEFGVKLRDYVKTLHTNGLNVQLSVDGETHQKLKALATSHLFRMVQESINNAVKHAGAKNILIQIQADVTAITLLVKDDGCGFDFTPDIANGHGLQNMRARAAELGGNFFITTAPGKGTSINIRMPLL